MNILPGLRLDPPTLLFSLALLSFLMAGVAFISASASPSERLGLKAWGRAMLCAGGAFLGFFLRGHVPLVLSLLLSNVLALGIPAFILIAHAQLAGRRPPWRSIGLSLVAGSAVLVATQFFHLPRTWAAFAVSATIAALLGMAVAVIARNRTNWRSPAAWVSGSMLSLMGLVLAFRAVHSLFGDATSVSPSSSSSAQVGALLAGAWFVVGSSMGYMSMVSERQRRDALERLRRDGLTGLYTRTAFFEQAKEWVAGQDPAPLAAVMIDIDHFKSINDTHGHAAGDATLAHVGRLIASATRGEDLAGRYGGEEFCVLLRAASEGEAAAFADQLLRRVRARTVMLGDGRSLRYALSIGYACGPAASGPGAADPIDAVIQRADLALYQAKRSGRDRAVSAAGLPSPAVTPQPLEPSHPRRAEAFTV